MEIILCCFLHQLGREWKSLIGQIIDNFWVFLIILKIGLLSNFNIYFEVVQKKKIPWNFNIFPHK